MYFHFIQKGKSIMIALYIMGWLITSILHYWIVKGEKEVQSFSDYIPGFIVNLIGWPFVLIASLFYLFTRKN